MDTFDFATAFDNALTLGAIVGFLVTFTCGFLCVSLGARA